MRMVTVVVTDHNTIAGYDKLNSAVRILKKWRSSMISTVPNIILGIEVSCADRI